MSQTASHVLMIAPLDLRFNTETAPSNAFMRAVPNVDAVRLSQAADAQHRALRDLLIENGITITVARSRPDTPDAPFCNNWFSTHDRGLDDPLLVLYPLLAPSRRLERRPDIVAALKQRYHAILDLSDREKEGVYLESTGSLCLDNAAHVAYAALSPRTHLRLADEWAKALGFRLVAFTATDGGGVPYYHTNVMMFIGHGLAGVCLESIADPRERAMVETSLRDSNLEILPITRAQVSAFAGNCLALANDKGEPLFVMSEAAYNAFEPREREVLQHHGRPIHTDLSAFETLGGGSARCLLGELF